MHDLIIMALASLAAGFIDAIVGGGGLITVPALFGVYPGAPPATLLGTNKSAAIFGTAWAAAEYSRRVKLVWSSLLPAAAFALIGSFLGAWSVTLMSPDGLRRALPFILGSVLLYTLIDKNLGQQHARRFDAVKETRIACLIGAVVGYYDGFFGPGTGSFFVFLFVRVLGYDFLHASASAKILNAATNFAAIVLFTAKGHVWWHVVLVMAICNVIGSLLGTRMALQHGTRFVRAAFVCVVAALIVKLTLFSQPTTPEPQRSTSTVERSPTHAAQAP